MSKSTHPYFKLLNKEFFHADYLPPSYIRHLVEKVFFSVCHSEMPQRFITSAKDLKYSKSFSTNIYFLSIYAFPINSRFINLSLSLPLSLSLSTFCISFLLLHIFTTKISGNLLFTQFQ